MTQKLERYAIFRKLPDGSPLWIASIDDFELAKQRVRDLIRNEGFEHFIHDFMSGVSIPVTPEPEDGSA